jgi:hypothetical protein
VKVGGEDVDLIEDEIYSGLRQRDVVDESMLDLPNFTFLALGDGGGKGGSHMQITKDERFFVKELSKDDAFGLNMMQLEYATHVCSLPSSLLARFYYRFRRINGQVSLSKQQCTYFAPVGRGLRAKIADWGKANALLL